jgi:Flp pilus assembly pilin Flp
MLTNLNSVFRTYRGLILDRRGQDLVEYALMAASIAVAAGAIFPTTVAPSISTIFSKVVSSFNATP